MKYDQVIHPFLLKLLFTTGLDNIENYSTTPDSSLFLDMMRQKRGQTPVPMPALDGAMAVAAAASLLWRFLCPHISLTLTLTRTCLLQSMRNRNPDLSAYGTGFEAH